MARRKICARKTAMERRITLDGTNTMKYHGAQWTGGGWGRGGQRQAGYPDVQCMYANTHCSEFVAIIARK